MKKITLLLLLNSFLGFSQWVQKGGDINGQKLFGTVIACNANGTIVAVGTPYAEKMKNSVLTADQGEVKVYEFIGNAWIQRGSTLDRENGLIAGVTFYSKFGSAIALSDDGNRIAIATEQNVKAFYFNGTDWENVATGAVLPLSTYAGNSNKTSLAMSNDGLRVVCGYTHDSYSDNIGKVVICELNISTNTWNQIGSTIESTFTYDLFGYSVSCNQDATRVVIGAPNHNSSTGRIKVFDYNPALNSWDAVAQVVNGVNTGDSFGYSVSMSDDGATFVVGAPYYDNAPNTDTGEVKVYYRPTAISNWVLKGSTLYPNGNQDTVYFGKSVSITANGDKIAVALPSFNDSSLPFDNGLAAAGRVKIYNYTASDWVFTSNINGTIASEALGSSISLSSDGTTIAVGSPAYKTSGGSIVTGDGLARVFQGGGLAVNDYATTTKFNLYPNPSNGKSTIDFSETIENIFISITNIEGKIVYTNTYNQTNQVKLDLNLQAGLYFVTVSSEKNSQVIKMIVKN